jgi:hypothetical protein
MGSSSAQGERRKGDTLPDTKASRNLQANAHGALHDFSVRKQVLGDFE